MPTRVPMVVFPSLGWALWVMSEEWYWVDRFGRTLPECEEHALICGQRRTKANRQAIVAILPCPPIEGFNVNVRPKVGEKQ